MLIQEKQKKVARLINQRLFKRRPHSIANHETSSSQDSDDEQTSPGPGQYYNPVKDSSFYKAAIPERHQFFSITEQRFKGS